MRIWTYVRPFQYRNEDYEVKFHFTFTTYTSQLFHNGRLLDEQTCRYDAGLKVIEHSLEFNDQPSKVTVSVGYYSMWNVGIEVREGGELIHASHPEHDVYYAENKIAKLNASAKAMETNEKAKQQSEKWQKNKHSIFADIGLGAAFFIVAKVTGDLTTAAFVGVALGLALVVIQRFVKVDLLGGFAVFGTVMLLISAGLSLAFQSEYFVQLKGTIMGLLSASVLLTDGIFRKGRYFGSRFERYLSSPVDHQYFVVGLALIGIVMAGINYGAATYLTEDNWLTYNTFFDTPVYLIMFFLLIWRAGKRVSK